MAVNRITYINLTSHHSSKYENIVLKMGLGGGVGGVKQTISSIFLILWYCDWHWIIFVAFFPFFVWNYELISVYSCVSFSALCSSKRKAKLKGWQTEKSILDWAKDTRSVLEYYIGKQYQQRQRNTFCTQKLVLTFCTGIIHLQTKVSIEYQAIGLQELVSV